MKRALASAAAALTLVVGVAAAGAGPDFAAFGLQPYEPPKAAPDFTLPDVDGRPRSLGDFRGKVLLLFFWATWWTTCREELPPVHALYRQFRDRGLEVALIAFRESPDLVKRTVRERGYTAPALIDRSGEVTGQRYGVFGPPTMYLIDRQGRLLARGVGPHDWAGPAARALMTELLGPPPAR